MLLRVGLWFVVFIHKPQRASNSPQVMERPKIHVFSEFLTSSILVTTSSNSHFSFPAAAMVRKD